MTSVKKFLVAAAAATAMLSAASVASADVVNGNFEGTPGGGQINFNTSETGWTVSNPSYFFVFPANGAAVNGAYGPVSLYGPPTGSPNGGFYVGSDPGFLNAAISQTLTGLTVGGLYEVSFYYAGAQQVGFNGATTEGWHVSFGSSSQDTLLLNNVNNGFTGWNAVTMQFTATAATQTLSFLANGTASQGAPPFALLDGVKVTAVPEPATWAMMILGMGMVGLGMRMRRRTASAVA